MNITTKLFLSAICITFSFFTVAHEETHKNPCKVKLKFNEDRNQGEILLCKTGSVRRESYRFYVDQNLHLVTNEEFALIKSKSEFVVYTN